MSKLQKPFIKRATLYAISSSPYHPLRAIPLCHLFSSSTFFQAMHNSVRSHAHFAQRARSARFAICFRKGFFAVSRHSRRARQTETNVASTHAPAPVGQWRHKLVAVIVVVVVGIVVGGRHSRQPSKPGGFTVGDFRVIFRRCRAPLFVLCVLLSPSC